MASLFKIIGNEQDYIYEADTRTRFAKYTDAETFAKIKEFDTTYDMWKRTMDELAGADGSKLAIEYDGTQHTYKELDQDIAGFRTILKQNGLAKGDRAGIYAPNSYDLVVAFMACATFGVTAAILPAQLPAEAVMGVSMMFGLKAVIAHPALEANTELYKAKIPTALVISASARSEDKTAPDLSVTAKDGATILFTGGTTGKSKGALLSQGALMQGATNGCYGVPYVFDERYLLVLPLSHVFGLVRNLLTCLATGSSMLICKNNKDMFKDVAIFKPTTIVMVPALAEMALGLSKQFGRNMLQGVRSIICGAARVAPYLVTEYAKTGTILYPGYGLTESANLVAGNSECARIHDAVGIPYPHQELRVVNGELWLKGPNMMDGYVGSKEANDEAYEDGWFKTGDLVRFDDEGLLYIVGRTKEIIVLSNGENVSPQEVEGKFNSLDIIQDSQVFEDIEGDEHILALEVVPRASEIARLGLAPEQVQGYILGELKKVNASLRPFERVQRMVVRTQDFERTPAMKIVRYHKC